jgi:hypothetical protein
LSIIARACVTAQSKQHGRFASLVDLFERVPSDWPHDPFRDSARASQISDFIDRHHLIVVEKDNFATRAAALIMPSVGDNRLRHETPQRFMLATTASPSLWKFRFG